MEFIDKYLQELDRKAQPIIKAHLQRLNDLSNDIKSLDNLFNNSGCIDQCIHNIGKGEIYFCHKQHKICFREEEDWNGTPLIECPVHIRFRAEPHLSRLLEKFIHIMSAKKGGSNGSN